MTKITITIEINKKKHSQINMDIEAETFNKITEICKQRKYDISDLLINDITEMTPEEVEEILFGWDL